MDPANLASVLSTHSAVRRHPQPHRRLSARAATSSSGPTAESCGYISVNSCGLSYSNSKRSNQDHYGHVSVHYDQSFAVFKPTMSHKKSEWLEVCLVKEDGCWDVELVNGPSGYEYMGSELKSGPLGEGSHGYTFLTGMEQSRFIFV